MTTVADNDTSMKMVRKETEECTPTFEKEYGAASMMPALPAGCLMNFLGKLFPDKAVEPVGWKIIIL